MSISIALADDHALVLHGLKRLLDGEPEFNVVRTCTNGQEAVAAATCGEVEILLLDVKMPGITGMDVLRTLAGQHTSCKTVLLTAALSEADALEALRLGAWGIVLKEASPDTLLDCIRRVAAGEHWVDREAVSRSSLPKDPLTDTLRPLTARETEIVRMITQGLRNKAIAERLSISEGTVKIHLHNVYEKLGVDGRLELMLHAQKQGLV